MSNITLELREQDSDRNYGNGDWETHIEPQILYPKDQIVMRNVFIDTEATSNEKINIPEDLTLDLEYIYYFNFYLPKDGNAGFFRNAGDTANAVQDGKTYIQNRATLSGKGNSGVKAIDSVLFSIASGQKEGFVVPATDFEVFYTDVDGNPASIKLHLPSFKNVSGLAPNINTSKGVKFPHPIFARTDITKPLEGLTFKPTASEFNSAPYHCVISFVGSGLLEDQIVCEPVKGKSSFTLVQGSYSPVDLCNYINTQLTAVVPENANLYSGNQFLISNRLIGVIGTQADLDLASGAVWSKGGEVLLGASKVELSYLDAQQKFAWDMYHTPMYDEDGTESVRVDPISADPNAKIQRQYSGVLWTHLGATKVRDGSYFDFWKGLLGFEVEKLYPVSRGITALDETIAPMFGLGTALDPIIVIQSLLDFNVTDITNTTTPPQATGGFCGIDALVPKGKTFTHTNPSGKNFFLPVTSTDGGYFVPTNGVNRRIIGDNSVLGTTSQFGYFVIEVQGKFRNDVIGSGINKNNVVGIVGRFYELNSYTQGTEGDSIVYQHEGEPIMLDAFKCRILDSSKTLADNIGNDNTIFLTINRGQAYIEANLPAVAQQALANQQKK
tara:strand:- start:3690 stop:5525 length:1836 start_codon:yes stop_codon:yes gene_type:complete